jgi:hypothetical protein
MVDFVLDGIGQAALYNWAILANTLSYLYSGAISREEEVSWNVFAVTICHPCGILHALPDS